MKTITKILDSAGNAANTGATAVSAAASSAVSALPSTADLRRGLGKALVLGGQALIDPREAIGRIAIELGESLASDEAGAVFVALVATPEGLKVVEHGAEEVVRAAAEQAREAGEQVLLCTVIEATPA